MLILKYICVVIAIVSTCLYISNTIADIGSAITWRTSLTLQGEPNVNDMAKTYAIVRIILSVIMGLSWGAVVVL